MQLRSSRLHSAGYGDGLLKAVRAVVKISPQKAVQRLRVSGSVQRLRQQLTGFRVEADVENELLKAGQGYV